MFADVLHERLPARIQAWLELYGICIRFLYPYDTDNAVPFVQVGSTGRSHRRRGSPFRWLIKGMLLIGSSSFYSLRFRDSAEYGFAYSVQNMSPSEILALCMFLGFIFSVFTGYPMPVTWGLSILFTMLAIIWKSTLPFR